MRFNISTRLKTSKLLTTFIFALISLSACTDHVAEAEDILTETKSESSYIEYLAQIQNTQSYELRMLFSSEEVGSTIDSIQFKFTSPYLTSDYLYQYQLGEIRNKSLEGSEDTISMKAHISVDTNSLDFWEKVELYTTANSRQTIRDTLVQIHMDKQTFHQAHHVFGVATENLADGDNSVLSSLLQSLKKAQTHANLAFKSNHSKHFRHTAQFLFGREGRNPEWVTTAPINSVDTISVTEQLNYIERYLVDQAKWASGDHSDEIIQLKNAVTQLHDDLIAKMDLIEDWFELEDTQAKAQAQGLIDVLDEGVPLLEGLISEVSPHLVQKVELK